MSAEIHPSISSPSVAEPESSVDYSILLREFTHEYWEDGQYLQAGNPATDQGWGLHVCVLLREVADLIRLVIPELLREGVAFSLVKNRKTASAVLHGYTGSDKFGKILTVYPQDTADAQRLALQLIHLTRDLEGPDIAADHPLQNCVFTRYERFPTQGGYTGPPASAPVDAWPFGEIGPPRNQQPLLLYKDKYRPVETIKIDAKGSVIKALYWKGFLKFRTCIIKEAKYNMSADPWGRTVQDRLRWQYDLYREYAGRLPFPEAIDLFPIGKDLYLVMEYVDGTSLQEYLGNCYAGANRWIMLPRPVQQRLLKLLAGVVRIVARLHQLGLVHRDLTPVNLMIEKDDTLRLIDIELTYSLGKQFPTPPFKSATLGYASPEQLRNDLPTIKEDVYGLGGLMVYFFCGFPSIKLNVGTIGRLYDAMLYFTGDPAIAGLVAPCFHEDPEQRTDLGNISRQIEELSLSPRANERPTPPPEEPSCIDQMIRGFIAGLDTSLMSDTDGIWTTVPGGQIPYIAQFNRTYSPSLANGAAGVLYFLARNRREGYSNPATDGLFRQNWNQLLAWWSDNQSNLSAGLTDGLAGFAIAVGAIAETAYCQDEAEAQQLIGRCFARLPEGLSLASGLAGAGIAVNQCSRWLGEARSNELSNHILQQTLARQSAEGYWQTAPELAEKEGLILGLGFGTAGVAYYLMDYLQLHPEEARVTPAIHSALRWLIKQARNKKDQPVWNASTRTKNILPYSVYSGTAGLCLCFIKAYELFQEPAYSEMAVRGLRSIPALPSPVDLTQVNGLAGLGEVYLEATRVLKDEEWQQRADCIVEILWHCFQGNGEGAGYWGVNSFNTSSAMLLTGCAGPAHFLLRYQNPEKVRFCVLQS